jgi:DNA-binding transcriptional ArsR family regulator
LGPAGRVNCHRLLAPALASLAARNAATGCAQLLRLTARGLPLILNHMVSYQAKLDRTFAALADGTRRAILQRLSQTPNLTISELAEPFPVSLPNIMKHIGVLAEAGLLTRDKTGRSVRCKLLAAPLEEATQWLNRYEKFWTERLDALGRYLEGDQWQRSKSRASGLNVTTPPGSKGSLRRGRTRKH